jgi:hypothetical protein
MNRLINFNVRAGLLLFITVLTLNLFACKKEESKTGPLEQSLSLSQTSAFVELGQTLTLNPNFDEGKVTKPIGKYSWTSEDPSVASVYMNKDFSVTVTARKIGVTTIKLRSKDAGDLAATCEVIVEPKPDGILRILAIGNSFSADAVENHLYDIAKAAGVPVIIGNIAIAGGPLDAHVSNWENNAKVYDYVKIMSNGTKTTTTGNALDAAVINEHWNYISFQQVSQNSGQYATIEASLPKLFGYVKAKASNRRAKYMLHQTWAYAQNSTHAGFVNYDNDQMKMYNAIVDAYKRTSALTGIETVIPAGTAIQNARTTVLGDNFTRDGYHLSLTTGRYIAALTWFEKITGKSVIGNSYKPVGINPYIIELAQHAAHLAVQEPEKVTEMVNYQQAGTGGVLTHPVQINFGQNSSAIDWNTLQYAERIDGFMPNLYDNTGKFTGISMRVIERFNGSNANGSPTTNTAMNMPSSVSGDSYFGNSRAIFDNNLVVKSVLRFTGLNKDLKYNMCFYGSRTGVADNRETKYIAKGANEVFTLLNTSNNVNNIACAEGIRPDQNGEVVLTVTMGENNNNSTGFYYISAMRLTQSN